jgi:hypothetical protein
LSRGDVQRGSGRIERRDVDSTLGEKACEGAGSTSDVQYRPAMEFLGQIDIEIEITPVRIQRIVDFSESLVLEDRICHATLSQGAG